MLRPEDIDQIVAVLDCKGNRFTVLVRASGLNPERAFRGADLRGIDLQGEDLKGFDFAGADLTGADLRGADLSNAHGLNEAILVDVVTDAATRWRAPRRLWMTSCGDEVCRLQ